MPSSHLSVSISYLGASMTPNSFPRFVPPPIPALTVQRARDVELTIEPSRVPTPTRPVEPGQVERPRPVFPRPRIGRTLGAA